MAIIPHDDDLLDVEIGRGGLDLPPAVERLDVDAPLDIGRRGPPGEAASGVDRHDVPGRGRGRGLTIWDWERRRADRPGRADPPGKARGLTLRGPPEDRGRGRR